MFPNAKGSEQFARIDTVPFASTAAGTVTSNAWNYAGNFHKFMVVIDTGTLGASATVDAKLQQATSSGGANAKDIPNKAITQIVKASGDNKQVIINLDVSELDTPNGFDYFQVSVTVGTATSVVGAAVYGVNPRFAPASDFNNASVVQVVA